MDQPHGSGLTDRDPGPGHTGRALGRVSQAKAPGYVLPAYLSPGPGLPGQDPGQDPGPGLTGQSW